jgi:enamine deaminase RidA (YjgF/YER057c/UK114 family)
MTRRLISTGSPFETTYGYSRAVVDGDLVFIAGTTGYDYATMVMPEDVAEQTRNIFRTISAVLEDAGSGLSHLLRIQIFVTDASYCIPVQEVCGSFLKDIRPASGIYVIAGLLKPEMKVEIEATARLAPAA